MAIRYNVADLSDISLITETAEGHQWMGDSVSFQHQQGNHFDVIFNLTDENHHFQLALQDIDLSLFIPTAPKTVQGIQKLTRWFLTEREFNRQHVIFEPESKHVHLLREFAGYSPQALSISLTNGCLGAGYWEFSILAQTGNGDSEKIYQGYFTFPRGAYARLVSQLNSAPYWRQARNLEAWPRFRFLSGMTFDLDALRQVNRSEAAPITDLASERILAMNEQVKKANLIVYADDSSAEDIKTWENLRQGNLKFQSFVQPGIYDPNSLWESDFSQLATVKGSTARQIFILPFESIVVGNRDCVC